MSFWKKIFGLADTDHRGRERLSWKENLSALNSLPRFIGLIWQTSKSLTLTTITLRTLKSAIPLLMLYVGKLIIDEVILQAQATNPDTNDLTYMWYLVLAELGLALVSDLLNRAIMLTDALLGDLFANKTSVQLIEHAAKLDLQKFEDSNFYDKLERARRQTTTRTVLMSQLMRQVEDFITMLFLIGGLIVFSPWLILLLVVAVIPSFLSETYFNQHDYSLARSWTPQRRELDYLRYIGASDETAKEIKIFGLAGFLAERFDKLADEYYDLNKSLAMRRAGWGGFFNTIGTVAYYGAYALIITQTIAGLISVGDLTFLSGSFNRLRNLLQGMLSRFSKIAQSALYLQDMFDFFDMKPSIISLPEAKQMPQQIKEGFVFENVGFQYPGTDIWAVRGLNFTLRAGEKLALVGENGAGKTTLVKLLERLYDPTEGRIMLDGVDIRNYDLISYRNAIGVIFQDFVRFQMTASENIAIGQIAQQTDTNRIVDSAEQSLADKVIAKLPAQYDQMLGRRFKGGVDLSGGEWQKVALGRAYMRDAQLVILDEPTAALDARAEHEVFLRFTELTKGKTAVLISHRFSTVRMADRILVLKNGQKVEIGSHEELLAQKGLYSELFLLQAAGYK